jgi:hypothetical protein
VPGSADVEEFAAATDGTDLYVAWTARPNALLWQKLGAGPRGEQRYVLASACETGLRRWQEPQRLAELKGELGREVRVAARDGLAGVLWMDGFRTGDVQVSLRSGGTWQEPRRFAVPVSGDGTIDGELVGTLTHGLVLLASPADWATGDVLLVTRLGTNSELAFRWPADPRFTRLSLRAACFPEGLLYVISGQGAIRLRTIELPGPRY